MDQRVHVGAVMAVDNLAGLAADAAYLVRQLIDLLIRQQQRLEAVDCVLNETALR